MHREPKGSVQAKEFGKRVREVREQVGVSQEMLADVCGVHRTYIGSLERGEVNPTLYSIIRVATALRVDPADLVRDLPPAELPPWPTAPKWPGEGAGFAR